MGITDIRSADYTKIKRAYNILQEQITKGIPKGKGGDENSAFKDHIVTALTATVHAMDKHLHKFVDGSTLNTDDKGADARETEFKKMIASKAEALLEEFNKKLNERHSDKGLLHSPDKQVFKRRTEKLIEQIVPNFFLNLCRELDKFWRKLVKDKTVVVRPQDKLETLAREVLDDMNVKLERNRSAVAKKALTTALSGQGKAGLQPALVSRPFG